MKITIIAGARPNFMKIAPLMRAINAAKAAGKNISARLVYTGSDEDKSLEPSLFTDLDMPRPDAYLRVDDTDFFQRMAGIVVAFARELEKHPAQIVIVVDDLTPTMACSIVAKKKGLKVAHLVAGTRSFDMDMPKEVNRMITDGYPIYCRNGGKPKLKPYGNRTGSCSFCWKYLNRHFAIQPHKTTTPCGFLYYGSEGKRIRTAYFKPTYIN